MEAKLTSHVGVKLTPEECAELARLARENDRSLSAEGRRAIRRYLAEMETATKTDAI